MGKNYCLYIHENKTNGKKYIGITNDTSKRWCGKGQNYDRCPRFWAAIQKYGWDGFSHTVVLTGLSLSEANELEIAYIKKYRTCEREFGYNIATGGSNAPTMLGKHHSAETRRKMHDAAVGRVISDSQRERHAKWMSENFCGSRNPMSRAVRCITTGEVFESMRIAAQAKGVLQSKISMCCNGKASHVHGLRWEYADKAVI